MMGMQVWNRAAIFEMDIVLNICHDGLDCFHADLFPSLATYFADRLWVEVPAMATHAGFGIVSSTS